MWTMKPRRCTVRRSAFVGWCGIVWATLMICGMPPELQGQQRQRAIQLESGTLGAPQVAFVSDSASLTFPHDPPSGSRCARSIIMGGVIAYVGTYFYGFLFAIGSAIGGEKQARRYFRVLKVVAIATTAVTVLIEASGPACQSPPETR